MRSTSSSRGPSPRARRSRSGTPARARPRPRARRRIAPSSSRSVAGAPLYVVHVSCRRVDRADRARPREGLEHLAARPARSTSSSTRRRSRSPTSRAASTCTRRRRGPRTNQEHLWKALKSDVLSVVSTDHCPFNWPEQKGLGRDEFSKIPNGGPGIENRLHMLYTFGVNGGRFSLNRFVELMSTNAAKHFGLYPRKGTIAPGSDADIVVWDPGQEADHLGEHPSLERQLQPVRGHAGHGRARGRARPRPGDRRERRARRLARRRQVRQAGPLRRGAVAGRREAVLA